ncbi:MAG: hypothetical protein HWD86_08090 [Kangiellaceae bacterium]|nr:hypothetical protein [Kangiellaceae bacterium]
MPYCFEQIFNVKIRQYIRYELVLILLFLLVLSLLSGCKKQYSSEHKSSATIRFLVVEKNAPKRILVVDAYTIDQCVRGQSLTKKHPGYRGQLLNHKQLNGDAISQEVVIDADKPITLTASLSHVYDEDNSEICYTQFHQFMPTANGEFEVEINQYCEVKIFDLSEKSDNDNTIAQDPDLINCI